MGTFVPFLMISSISFSLPTPVSKQIIASLIYGIKMRFARKPGESADLEATLPMRSQKATAVASVAAEVCRPEMISTPFCTGTGFMKCVLTTRELAERSVGSEVVAPGVINYPVRSLGLCAGMTNARYVTTTEVYPDSPRATPEQCNEAQAVAVRAALDHVLAAR